MYYLKIWNSSPSLATAGFFVAYSKMPNWNMNPLRFFKWMSKSQSFCMSAQIRHQRFDCSNCSCRWERRREEEYLEAREKGFKMIYVSRQFHQLNFNGTPLFFCESPRRKSSKLSVIERHQPQTFQFPTPFDNSRERESAKGRRVDVPASFSKCNFFQCKFMRF